MLNWEWIFFLRILLFRSGVPDFGVGFGEIWSEATISGGGGVTQKIIMCKNNSGRIILKIRKYSQGGRLLSDKNQLFHKYSKKNLPCKEQEGLLMEVMPCLACHPLNSHLEPLRSTYQNQCGTTAWSTSMRSERTPKKPSTSFLIFSPYAVIGGHRRLSIGEGS